MVKREVKLTHKSYKTTRRGIDIFLVTVKSNMDGVSSSGGGSSSTTTSGGDHEQQQQPDDIHSNRAWELLKFLLKASGVVVSKDALKEIIYVTNETDGDLLGRRVQQQLDTATRKRSFLLRALEKDSKLEQTAQDQIDWQTLSRSLVKIEEELAWVKGEIAKGTSPPEECPLWEYTCAVVSMTLKKDYWYENGRTGQTRRRDKRPLRKFMWVVFYLRCWYRLWWRRSAIPAEKNPDVPIWGTIDENYTFDGERVFTMPKDEKGPIMEWSPSVVINALEELMMGRLVGHCKMRDVAVVSLFEDYRAGLLDRVALIVCQPVAGVPKTIFPPDERLFRERIGDGGRAKTLAEIEEEGLAGQDERVIAHAKKIKEFQQNETAKRRKILEVEDGERPKQAPLAARLADAKFINASRQLGHLRAELAQKQAHLRLLKHGEDGEEVLDYDAELISRLETDVTDLEHRIKLDENSEIMKAQMAMEAEQQKAREITRRKILAISQSECRDLFVEKISILVDHIYFWQFPCSGLWLRSFQDRHLFLKQSFFDAIVDSGKWTNEKTYLENCEQWIVSFDIIFPERESYRIDFPESKFSALDVCSSRRDEGQLKLEGFPSEEMTDLYTNRSHPWYSRAWIYIVRHYIVQKYPTLPVDSTIFLFDLEEECCSLNRAPLKNPAIGRSCYEWISLRGGAYFTSNENLKGVWCGEDILDCLICWCEMMEEMYPDGADWVVYDRLTGKPYVLKGANEIEGICELFRSSVLRFLNTRQVDHGGGGDVEGEA